MKFQSFLQSLSVYQQTLSVYPKQKGYAKFFIIVDGNLFVL